MQPPTLLRCRASRNYTYAKVGAVTLRAVQLTPQTWAPVGSRISERMKTAVEWMQTRQQSACLYQMLPSVCCCSYVSVHNACDSDASLNVLSINLVIGGACSRGDANSASREGTSGQVDTRQTPIMFPASLGCTCALFTDLLLYRRIVHTIHVCNVIYNSLFAAATSEILFHCSCFRSRRLALECSTFCTFSVGFRNVWGRQSPFSIKVHACGTCCASI